MDSEEIRRICIQSCEDMYEQMTAMQKGANPRDNKLVSMTVNEVTYVRRKEEYLVIGLSSRINDVEGLGLSIEHVGTFFDEVDFSNYDDHSVTVRAYPTPELMAKIRNVPDEDIKVIFDMKWLIELTCRCFNEHGHLIGYPREPVPFEEGSYTFPGGTPNDDQKDAVDAVLNSSMSYIWGAPGTGKTQFVIATAAIAHLKRGEKVVILAPTNNAVEQALRGVMKVIEQDDPEHTYINPSRDILRLGSATKEFLEEFREICSDRSRSVEIQKIRNTFNLIGDIFFERGVERAKADIDAIRELYEGEYDHADYDHKLMIEDQIRIHWDSVKTLLRFKEEFAPIADNVDEYNLRSSIDDIARILTERDRYPLEIEEYRQMDDIDLAILREDCAERLEKLSQFDENARVKSARILAMTPFTLMARASTLLGDGGITDAGHIFIDEIGYANLIQMLPVFMVGAPVAMLGDHMQLPPVCEVDFEMIKTWAERGGYMEYAFLWDASARYTESMFFGGIEEMKDDYLLRREPRFKKTRQANLLLTHRFADNLASILDDCVYRNGISGISHNPLEIICYDVVGENPKSRANRQEADAVFEIIKSLPDDGSYAVLTPYNDQRHAIIDTCGKKFEKSILTVHSSQGREWDTVILSVSDNRNSDRSVPYRFTSTVGENQGLRVINTAVSRAKKKLIIVCDREFWAGRAEMGDLIGRLVANPETKVLHG